MKKIKVLFVCMGNICRSPTAHGVFRQLVDDERVAHLIEIDSAGTTGYHAGERPDARARQVALSRGIDLSDLRARKAREADFRTFDYVLAMDKDNYRSLSSLCPPEMERKLMLMMDFAPELGVREVPDPYYGGPSGFDQVLDMIEVASRGLLDDIKRRHLT